MYWPSGVHAGDTMICGRSLVRPILADRARIRAVGVGDPEVLDAGAIAEERDRLAVGRPRRLAFERQPADDARGRAAVDRQRVEIAEHVEDDRPAVGRDVHRRPRHFVGRELDRAGGLEDQFLRPALVAGFLLLRAKPAARARRKGTPHDGERHNERRRAKTTSHASRIQADSVAEIGERERRQRRAGRHQHVLAAVDHVGDRARRRATSRSGSARDSCRSSRRTPSSCPSRRRTRDLKRSTARRPMTGWRTGNSQRRSPVATSIARSTLYWTIAERCTAPPRNPSPGL